MSLTPTAGVLEARRKWRWRGDAWPEFAHPADEHEESVWDYPRPPVIVPDGRLVEVRGDAGVIARAESSLRVLETASPPAFYFEAGMVDVDALEANGRCSRCEWKGIAESFDVVSGGERLAGAAWSYRETYPEFEALTGCYAFHPGRIACRLAGDPVYPQPGDYYGGWVTREVIGPFKGAPGTEGW